jgi:hypothetical protein
VTIVFYFHFGSAIGILYEYIIWGVLQCIRHQVIFVSVCAMNI